MSAPVLETPFIEQDWSWLKQLTAEVNESRMGNAVLGITGLSCQSCVWLVEKIIDQRDEIGWCKVIFADQSLHLEFLPQADLPALAHELQRYGFILVAKPRGEALPIKPPSKGLLAFGIVFSFNALMFQAPRLLVDDSFELTGLFNQMSFLFFVLALITGGHYLLRRTVYRASLKS